MNKERQVIVELEGFVGILKEFKAKSGLVSNLLELKFSNLYNGLGERFSRYFKVGDMSVVIFYAGLERIESSSCIISAYSLKERQESTWLDFTLDIDMTPDIVSDCSKLLNETVELRFSIEEDEDGEELFEDTDI